MKAQPLVSAIIPTYNREHIIAEAVDSVLAQTYPNIEIVIVDDGSKDRTLEVLRAYGDKTRVIAQANAGPAAARNRGIRESQGELIAFLDSDDIWLPTKTERQVNLLQRAGEKVTSCLSNILMQWKSGDRSSFEIALLEPSTEEGIWLNVDEVLATRSVLFNQGIMIRRQVIEKIGGFDESIRYLEDYEFPLRLSLEGPWAFINTPLVVWRESMTNSVYKNSVREDLLTSKCMVTVFESHLARVEEAQRQPRLRNYVKSELKKARRHLRTGELAQSSPWGTSLAKLFNLSERYRSALYRRSPWFPRMDVVAVNGQKPASSP